MPWQAAWVISRSRPGLGLAFAAVLGASCGSDPAPSAIDAVISEPAPGVGAAIDRVELVVERTTGDARLFTRTPDRVATTIEPIAIRVSPEASGDVGRTVYRLRAQGYAAGALVVTQQHRVVFVPERTITLPFRFEASCVGVACVGDTTCVAGACVDDAIAACALAGAEGSPFCRGDASLPAMDAFAPQPDARVPPPMPDARIPPDATTDAFVEPDARTGCDDGMCTIDGRCFAVEERNPSRQCEHCYPFVSPTTWTIAVDYPCDDGLWCSVGERCDAMGECVTPPDRRCFDGEGCTSDVCNEDTDACEYPPVDGSCSAGGGPGRCCNGLCIPTTAPCF